MDNELLTIRQISRELGIPKDKIRYYCKRGLVPNVKRSKAGYRVLNDWQMSWVSTLYHLECAGLKLNGLKQYAKLCRQGKATIRERRALIATARHQLSQQMSDLNQSLNFLSQRDELFDEILQERAESDTDWI